jgi:hypothetical protein
LAGALERLLVDPSMWLRMSEAGREFARTRFGVERMVSETERSLNETARQGSG